MRNYSVNANKWSEAQVNKKLGPVTYTLRTATNNIVKRHADQMIPTNEMATIDRGKDGGRASDVKTSFCRRPFENQTGQSSYSCDYQVVDISNSSGQNRPQASVMEDDKASNVTTDNSIVPVRRSTRTIRKPDRLNL